MSEESGRDPKDELPEDPEGDAALRALIKRAHPDPGSPSMDLLQGTQARLRARSGGKFFGDGWSTAPSTTRYVIVAVAMLVIVALAFALLGPVGVGGP